MALVVGATGVSFASILIRKSAAQPAAIAAYRLSLTVVLLIGPAVFLEKLHALRMSRRDIAKSALSGAFLAAHFLSWITSLGYTSVASSVVLVSCHTLLIVFYTWATTGQMFNARAMAGVVVALVGTAVIGAKGWQAGAVELLGDGLALLGAACMAAYCVIGRDVRQRVGVLSYVVLVYGTASAILFGACLLLRVPIWPYPASEWRIFWALAMIPTLFGHTVFNWALRYVPAWAVSASTLGEPVGATVLAYVLLRESPGAAVVAGGIMVVVGLYTFLRNDVPQPRRMADVSHLE